LKSSNRVAGVTLIEMLVSVVILLILMTIIFQIIQMVSQAWKKSSQSTGTMQQARVAFERLTRNLSQATLNTYYSYYYASGSTTPSYYMRQSELELISGTSPVNGTTFISSTIGNATQITHAVFFQSPLGVVNPSSTASYGNLTNLLNACGYFIIYGKDTFRPPFLGTFSNAPPNESRYRLMEYLQPSENLSIYTTTGSPAATSTGAVPAWISYGIPDLTVSPPVSPITVRPLASNIIALIIMPEQFAKGTTLGGQQNTTYVNSQTSSYNYDSAYQATTLTAGKQSQTANQLPPLVKVIMVAIDEPSAIKLAAANPGATTTSPPNLVPSTLFQDPSKLFTTGGVEGDLDKFQDILNASPGNVASNTIKLNYYIFQTDVIIRGSKWTSQ
jgi:uncharacterized protein (TIGR02599 family)